ncbi:MAG: LppX_LprAFG lipoprotein [Chloroflexi bacterium]|nr:LppX_LprAFG lipoprotein [Chloroflexota bacterium]
MARLTCSGILMIGALTLSSMAQGGCSPVRPGPTVPVAEVLSRAAERLRDLESVHFVLDVQGRVAPLANDLEIVKADGDLKRPGDARMKATLRSQGAVFETELWIVNGRTYARSPLGSDITELPGGTRVALLDPENGLPAAVVQIQSPQLLRADVEDGGTVHRIRGSLPTPAVAKLIGGTPHEGVVTVEAGVRAVDSQVSRLVLTGRALVGDDQQVVRTIVLSAWNTPVSIQPPG